MYLSALIEGKGVENVVLKRHLLTDLSPWPPLQRRGGIYEGRYF